MSANVLYIGVSEVCIVLVCDNTDNIGLHTHSILNNSWLQRLSITTTEVTFCKRGHSPLSSLFK